MKIRSGVVNICILLFGLLAALGLGEVLLRTIPNDIAFVDNGIIRDAGFMTENDYDPQTGFWPKASKILQRRGSCYDSGSIHFNALGLRSMSEVRAEKRTKRVALFGDSFLQALQVGDGEDLTSLLSLIFNQNIEFLNFGVAGTGTIFQYQAWLSKARQLKPDLVILYLFTGNDISDNHPVLTQCYTGKNTTAMLPYLRNTASGTEVIPPTAKVLKRYATDTDKLSISSYIKSRLFIWAALNKAIGMVRPANIPEEVLLESTRCPCWPGVPEMLPSGVYGPPKDKYWQEAWQQTENAINMFGQSVRASGSEFMVALVPYNGGMEIYKALVKSKYPSIDISGYSQEYTIDRLQGFVKSKGYPVLSLYNQFDKYRRNNSLSNKFESFRCDGHWNPLGHLVAALSTAEFIINESSLLSDSQSIANNISKRIEKLQGLPPRQMLGEKAAQEIYEEGVLGPADSKIRQALSQ